MYAHITSILQRIVLLKMLINQWETQAKTNEHHATTQEAVQEKDKTSQTKDKLIDLSVTSTSNGNIWLSDPYLRP